MSDESLWPQVTPVPLPPELARKYGASRAVPVYAITDDITTWQCIDEAGTVGYCKVVRTGTGNAVNLGNEASRLQWCERLPLVTPSVVEQGGDGDASWLVTREVPGVPLHHLKASVPPAKLAACAGSALRTFHTLPFDGCPWSASPGALLEGAAERVERGQIDRDRDFHREHSHLSCEEALQLLSTNIPDGREVLTHGDFCFPNILLDPGSLELSGVIDLGAVAVGDPWWDLAVASWSVTWNLGPGHEDSFFEAYGITQDRERIAWYRLAYDLVA